MNNTDKAVIYLIDAILNKKGYNMQDLQDLKDGITKEVKKEEKKIVIEHIELPVEVSREPIRPKKKVK